VIGQLQSELAAEHARWRRGGGGGRGGGCG
jgi:hypothetical protein